MDVRQIFPCGCAYLVRLDAAGIMLVDAGHGIDRRSYADLSNVISSGQNGSLDRLLPAAAWSCLYGVSGIVQRRVTFVLSVAGTSRRYGHD